MIARQINIATSNFTPSTLNTKHRLTGIDIADAKHAQRIGSKQNNFGFVNSIDIEIHNLIWNSVNNS